jgi:hypothetical protein
MFRDQIQKRRAISVVADYSAVAMDIVLADAVGGDITVTFPAVHSINDIIVVKKIDMSMNLVTIDGDGNTIDGNPSIDLMSPFESVSIVSDGTNWFLF